MHPERIAYEFRAMTEKGLIRIVELDEDEIIYPTQKLIELMAREDIVPVVV